MEETAHQWQNVQNAFVLVQISTIRSKDFEKYHPDLPKRSFCYTGLISAEISAVRVARSKLTLDLIILHLCQGMKKQIVLFGRPDQADLE